MLIDVSLHTSRSATGRPEPIKLTVTTVEPGKGKKPKVGQAYSRLTELSKKGNLTDKVGRGRTGPAESRERIHMCWPTVRARAQEKKELRKLKAEEMCEMLGKGC